MGENKVRIGSALLIVHNDKILLGKRGKEPNFGKWVLPGGKIEFGETHFEAGVREAKEELGIDVTVGRLAGKGIYYIINENEHRIIIYSYAVPESLDIKASSDITEAKFFSKHEIASLEITPIVKQVLSDEGWLA